MIHRLRLYWVIALSAVLVGCAGSPSVGDNLGLGGSDSAASEPGPIIGEVSPPRKRARVHTELAAAYYQHGNLSVALQELRTALAADPDYAPAYNILGLVQMDLKELTKAQANFEHALKLAPNDPDINHNYGWFLCRTHHEDESIKYFLAAVRNPLYRTPQKSYALAGACALRKGHEKAARVYFERALRLDPTLPLALVNLAKIKYQAGELASARDLITRYNQVVEPTAESLWLAVRIERRLGDGVAESRLAAELGRRFPSSKENAARLGGHFE